MKGADVSEGGWFIIKNNSTAFPKEALHSILVARHGKRPAGHWVVMTTSIAGVDLTAIACAWSQNGVSYFVTTCGSTKPHEIKHQSKFEDRWGNTQVREIDRPAICHFLCEYLPLIDEHNKQRPSPLQLEKRWLTKNCWFRLVTTLVGMSVVDIHRIYRHHQIQIKKRPYAEVDNVRVTKFTDLICCALVPWPEKSRGRKTAAVAPAGGSILERIRDDQGNTTREVTDKQRARGKSTGNSVTRPCFICRRYIDQKTDATYQRTTSFWCKHCNMPLCSADRTKTDNGRTETCVQEHLCSDEDIFACNERHHKGKEVPTEYEINNNLRRTPRGRTPPPRTPRH